MRANRTNIVLYGNIGWELKTTDTCNDPNKSTGNVLAAPYLHTTLHRDMAAQRARLYQLHANTTVKRNKLHAAESSTSELSFSQCNKS